MTCEGWRCRPMGDEHGYQEYVRDLHAILARVDLSHDNEEMAQLALYTLITYETDEHRMEAWQEGLAGLFEVQRPERNPEHNLLYGCLSGAETYDVEDGVATLQEMSLSLLRWRTDNGHREDFEPAGADGGGHDQSDRVFPMDERQPWRWSENPYRLLYDGSGTSEASGTLWLLPYWGGRWCGAIRNP